MKIAARHIITITAILFLAIAVMADPGHSNMSPKQLLAMTDDQLRETGNKALMNHSNVEKALTFYNAVVNRHKGEKHLDEQTRIALAKTYNNMGYVYMFHIYDYTRALDNLLRAQELYGNRTDATLLYNLGMITNFYAQCFATEENISLSNKFLIQSFKTAVADKNWSVANSAFANLWTFGFDSNIIKMNSEALSLFKKIPRMKGNAAYESAEEMYQTVVRIKRKDYAGTIAYFRRQLGKTAITEDHDRERCYTLYLMATVFGMAGQQDSVLRYAEAIESIAAVRGLKDYQKDAAEMLSDYYTGKGDLEAARRYRLVYLEKRDSLLMQSNLNSVRARYLMHDLQKTAEEVEQLKEKRRQQTTVICLTLVGIAVAVGVALTVWRKNRQLRERNRILYRNNVDMLRREEQRRREEQKRNAEQAANKPQTKYQGSNLDDEAKEQLRQRIDAVMAQPDEICADGFSLERLATLCQSNYKSVSQVINEIYGQSFTLLLSEYRVKEACRRINDRTNYGNLTIEGISRSVGFKARSGFFRAFKRVTGMTPSEYYSIAREQQSVQNA